MCVLACPHITFYTTVRTTWEVERFIPALASFLSGRGIPITEMQLLRRFRALPLVALQDAVYRSQIPLAKKLITRRDPRDVDILALTLRLGFPLWTHDRDFEGIAQIRTVTTAELLAALER